jgi:hypothetical protein
VRDAHTTAYVTALADVGQQPVCLQQPGPGGAVEGSYQPPHCFACMVKAAA